MNTLDIPHSQASKAMTVIGTTEVIGRALFSYFGGHFKGCLLHVYIVLSLILFISNICGYLATTYAHLVLYAASMYLFRSYRFIGCVIECNLDNDTVISIGIAFFYKLYNLNRSTIKCTGISKQYMDKTPICYTGSVASAKKTFRSLVFAGDWPC